MTEESAQIQSLISKNMETMMLAPVPPEILDAVISAGESGQVLSTKTTEAIFTTFMERIIAFACSVEEFLRFVLHWPLSK